MSTHRTRRRAGTPAARPERHAYLAPLLAFAEAHARGEGVQHVTVAHDDWCSLFAGGPCDCSPVLRAGRTPDREAAC